MGFLARMSHRLLLSINFKNMKKSFVLFSDLLEITRDLSLEEQGKLFNAILIYNNTYEIPHLEGEVKGIFKMLLQQFKRDEEKYNVIVNRNKENGKKGGRPKETQQDKDNPENPVGLSETPPFIKNPTGAKKADNDIDIDIDIDNDIDNDNEIINTEEVPLPDILVKKEKKNIPKKPKEVKNEKNHSIAEDLLKDFNEYHGKNFRSVKEFEDNLTYWLTIFSIEEIKKAHKIIKIHDFWKDKMTLTIMLRQKNTKQEPVNYIDMLLNYKPPSNGKYRTEASESGNYFTYDD